MRRDVLTAAAAIYQEVYGEPDGYVGPAYAYVIDHGNKFLQWTVLLDFYPCNVTQKGLKPLGVPSAPIRFTTLTESVTSLEFRISIAANERLQQLVGLRFG